MSEAAYNPDPEQPPAYSKSEGAAEGDSGATRGGSGGSFTVDTTYPRSIEGILKLVTVVSRPSNYARIFVDVENLSLSLPYVYCVLLHVHVHACMYS